ARAGVSFVRFEAAFHAPTRVNFVALAELVGLGSPGPFGLLIHGAQGPWWALRGAWLVGADVQPPLAHASPCSGCPAPRGGRSAWRRGARRAGRVDPGGARPLRRRRGLALRRRPDCVPLRPREHRRAPSRRGTAVRL